RSGLRDHGAHDERRFLRGGDGDRRRAHGYDEGMKLHELLGDIVGAAHVLTRDEDTQPYFTDWRRQYSARAECVVRPASTQEVASVVRLCARENVAIVPQGGNTGLCGGSVPTGKHREIVVALARMNRIRSLDVLHYTVPVE